MVVKQSRVFSYLIASIFVLQLFFSLFYESFTGKRNLYPFYTGKIFHPRPDKYMVRHRGYVFKIDDVELKQPLDLLNYKVWHSYFPNMDRYTMSRKLHRLGEYIKHKNTCLAKKEKEEIDEILLQNHKFVEWELFRLTVDPIEFIQNEKIEKKKFIKRYESHR